MPILVIEGPDYSGKTILINDLKPVLKNAIFLWEPGSTPFADRQRELLKDFSVDPWAKQMLMHGSRYDMLAHHGWCMDAEKLYVIDRYELSTYVYGTVDGIPYGVIDNFLRLFPVPTPHLTVVLTPPFKYIEDRFIHRKGLDALEETPERLLQVYQKYIDSYKHYYGKKINITSPTRKVVLDEVIAELMWDKVLTKFVV